MEKSEYVKVLKIKFEEITSEITDLRKEVGNIFSKIEEKQEQAHHILELLSAEGYQPTNEEKLDSGQVHITDIAEVYLKKNSKNKPIHYRDLAKKIQSGGYHIPGKDPAANLLSQINRDDRFIRVSSGTYGLKEWDLKSKK